MRGDLHRDLVERWCPTEDQIALAEAVLAATGSETVVTCHLLTGKTRGFWNADVGVVALDGVFLDRNAALDYLDAAVAKHPEKCTGGYVYHRPGKEWAVFEAF